MDGTYRSGLDIAIIGMAGRFPGASSVEQFLALLKEGRQAISFFSDEELAQHGVEQELLQHPDYVKAKGLIEDGEYFDAEFFDYTPTEALIMDPQMRLVHEGVWEALETAGYAPDRFDGLIGLYVGGTPNPLWEALTFLADDQSVLNPFTKSLLNDKDLMATRVAYKLNLRGPSVALFTSCSTSLVTIYIACQALLSGECDIAVAGGVCATYPYKSGYMYQKGMHLSPDGCCRSFDADANGLVISDALGLVVLRRVDDAISAGDTIHALIAGSAINNDGRSKVGFTAPSVIGQAEVIRLAQQVAGVNPEEIGYIETHGSATPIGDNIELEALRRVFPTGQAPYCAIGSVKSNIGHTNSAAGVAGLIKAALSLEHRALFPSINFETPHPELEIESSPFYVPTAPRPWAAPDGSRYAGVSGFGVGGTNAHIVLREAPPQQAQRAGNTENVVVLSAKTATALQRLQQSFREYLGAHPQANLRDVAYTLQLGRSHFAHRKAFVAGTVNELLPMLDGSATRGVWDHVTEQKPRFVFLFAGQGKQYANMGRDLYRREPIFRDTIDACLAQATELTDVEYRRYLYPPDGEAAPELLGNTAIAQPVLFCFEYALARLLMHFGIRPSAMVGYSFGEITAACLAEVVSLKDAIRLVVLRGQFMGDTPAGAMLSVPLPEHDLAPLLDDGLAVAVDNGDSCIVSGARPAIDALHARLRSRHILCIPLAGTHAAHSALLHEAAERLGGRIAAISFQPPAIPFVSSVSGTWIADQEATDWRYWAGHMLKPIRFYQAILTLLAEDRYTFIEVGPGRDLANIVERFARSHELPAETVDLVRPEALRAADTTFFLHRLARLWTLGAEVQWQNLYADERRARVPLPTYPFEKQLYRLGKSVADIKTPRTGDSRHPDIAGWFYTPTWRRAALADPAPGVREPGDAWLVLAERHPLYDQVARRLAHLGQTAILVEPGDRFEQVGAAHFRLDPVRPADYLTLVDELQRQGRMPRQLLHLWPLAQAATGSAAAFVQAQRTGLYSLVYLLQAIERSASAAPLKVMVVTGGLQEVTGEEQLRPEHAPLLGALKVINQEFTRITCCAVDTQVPHDGGPATERLAARLIDEFRSGFRDAEIAYRGTYRWVKDYEPVAVQPVAGRAGIRAGGVYMITGGLGRIGVKLALHLARRYAAKVAIISRSIPSEQAPAPEEPERHGAKLARTEQLRQQPGIMLLAADVADKAQMAAVIATIERELGAINGVIHAAGITGKATSRAILDSRQADFEDQFAPKVYGTYVLEELLSDRRLDFCVLLSSLSPILGGLGYGGYAAANSFLDAFTYHHNRTSAQQWLSVNWETWVDEQATDAPDASLGAQNARLALRGDEGLETFERVVGYSRSTQVVISTGALGARIKQWGMRELPPPHSGAAQLSQLAHPRPRLATAYVAPRTPSEHKLNALWQAVLGIKEIGVQDHFFELGGDSLKLLNAIGAIYREFHVEIPVVEFFNHPTIEYIARKLDQQALQTYWAIPPAPHRDAYALSSAQQRLYYLHSLDPSSTTYNEITVFILKGRLDRQRVERALRRLIDRHEALRSSFELRDNRPVQIVHETVDFQIETLVASDAALDTASDAAIGAVIKPFALDRPPLVRGTLLDIGNDKHVMVLDMHHIITDGVSEGIVVREFMSLYNNAPLQPVKVQYKDYAEWQHRARSETDPRDHEQYWLNKLGGGVPPLNLPLDYPRPALQRFEGKSLDFTIDAAQTAALKTLAQRESVTLYMVFLTLYVLFLHKISGDEDFAVGTATSGRSHPDLQDTIGMFVNTLVVRPRCRADWSFTQLLQAVKTEVLDIFQHQDYQFDDLVEKLAIKRDFSRNPLFDAMFVWQNMDVSTMEIEGLTLIPFEYHDRSAKFDLTLMGYELADEIYLKFEYSTHLFKEDTIVRFTRCMRRLIQVVVHDAAQPIRAVALNSPDEQRIILADWNMAAAGIAEDASIDGAFEAQARRLGDRVAVVGQGGVITYRELDERSNQLARQLLALGVRKHSAIGVALEPSIDLLIGILGILKAGGVYVPIDIAYPEARKNYLLDDSAAEVVLTATHYHWAGLERRPTIDMDRRTYAALDPGRIARERSKHDPCYVMYTSGSTGEPKGVVIPHRGVLRLVVSPSFVTFEPDDRILQTSSPVFDASTFEYWGALLNGLTLHLATKETILDPQRLEQLIKAQHITIIWLTSSLFNQLCQQNKRIFETLRYLLVGGDVVSPRYVSILQESYPALKLVNGYGPTENTTFSTCFLIDSAERPTVPIGRPITGTQVYILDAYGAPQPVGIPGELCVAGDGLAHGYLGRPDLTAERFVPSPWSVVRGQLQRTTDHGQLTTDNRLYKTGDRARWLPDGTIEYLNRLDDQVKIHGFRIEPGEIEIQLQRHPAVDGAVVVVRETPKAERYLCAYYVSRRDLDPVDLKRFAIETLPYYMVPAYVIRLAHIPLTVNGKVDRAGLPLPEIPAPAAASRPRTTVERQLAALWSQTLGIAEDAIGIDQNLFDIGGTSLTIIELSSRIQEAFATQLPVALLFQYPTIQSLAEYLQQADDATPAPAPAAGGERDRSRLLRRRAQVAE